MFDNAKRAFSFIKVDVNKKTNNKNVHKVD